MDTDTDFTQSKKIALQRVTKRVLCPHAGIKCFTTSTYDIVIVTTY